MNINEYIHKHRKSRLCPIIKCKDGLKLSVQASSTHYCSPRNDFGPWSHFEIGFPSKKVEEIMEFAEDASKPCDTVYGYVPIEIVEYVIENHGGIDE